MMLEPAFVKLVSWYGNNLHLSHLFKKGLAKAARGYRAIPHVRKGTLC